MPGEWTIKHCTRLANVIRDISKAVRDGIETPLAVTTPLEITKLLQNVDFTQVGGIVDPWAGSNTIKVEFEKVSLRVFTNDVNKLSTSETHEDALQPEYYRKLATRVGVDAIVTSPWFALLDLALPLAVMAARAVVCMHIPGHYITDAHPRRSTYLKRLMEEERIRLLMGLPAGPMGRRCAWLLIFSSAAAKAQLLRKVAHHGFCCSYV